MANVFPFLSNFFLIGFPLGFSIFAMDVVQVKFNIFMILFNQPCSIWKSSLTMFEICGSY